MWKTQVARLSEEIALTAADLSLAHKHAPGSGDVAEEVGVYDLFCQ